MAKKAFCVGINDYPGQDNDLNGCVNDAHAWADLLVNHFDFPRADVKLITDAQATKQNMVTGIKSLLAGVQQGDVLVFTNSSHGAYQVATPEDEEYDEFLCPHDVMDNVLLDDELRELFAALPNGVQLTVILDNCFSGTATRAAPFRPLPDDRRLRFLNPELIGRTRLKSSKFMRARSRRPERYPESQMKEILLSAASDKQYATDAFIDGTPHGAFTYYAIQVIRAANYCLTYRDLRRQVRDLIAHDYSQDPQLEGQEENKTRQIFT